MTAESIKVTAANLQVALNKSVGLPNSTGPYLGRGFAIFQLSNISNPAMLGGDAFTEVYFTTSSGNLYKIWQDEVSHRWLLANVKENKGVGRRGKINSFIFPPGEIEKAVLEVGKPFHFHKIGQTTPIVAILAVNAGRCYTPDAFITDLACDIRKEFDQAIS